MRPQTADAPSSAASRLIAAALACALSLAVACSSGAADAPPTTWKTTLGELGYSEVLVPTDTISTASEYLAVNRSPQIPITLPPNARQGHDQVWVLYAHLVLEFEPDSGAGAVQITADVNDRTSHQLVVVNGGRGYRANHAELPGGENPSYTLDRLQTYRIANYAQTGGIKPGEGHLTFKLWIQGEARVKRLAFLEDTALMRFPIPAPTPRPQPSARAPVPVLHMQPSARDSTLAVGREFALDLRLTSDDLPVKSPSVQVIDPDNAFRIEYNPDARMDALSGTRTLRYAITPLKAGERPLYFSASTANAGNPEVRLIATVHERDSLLARLSRPPMLWMALTGFSTIASWTVCFYVWRRPLSDKR